MHTVFSEGLGYISIIGYNVPSAKYLGSFALLFTDSMDASEL